MTLLQQHQAMLDASGISPAIAAARGYQSVSDPAELAAFGFAPWQRSTPTMLIPAWNVCGEIALHLHRPDAPRVGADGRPRKYEFAHQTQMSVDVHPHIRHDLKNPDVPLWITEGTKKADAAVSAGLCCIDILGVWNWRDKMGMLPDWDAVAFKDRENKPRTVFVAFDSDVVQKKPVFEAMRRLSAVLKQRGAAVQYVYLPDGDEGKKTGVDDYLAAGHTVADLLKLASPHLRAPKVTDRQNTEIGNALRLCDRHGDDLRYLHPKTSHGYWLNWNGERWQTDETGEVRRLAQKTVLSIYAEAAALQDDQERKARAGWAVRSETLSKIDSMITLAETQPGIPVSVSDLDADLWLLNCQNGTLDLRTGELLQHTREHLITKQIPVAYDPEAKCPEWTRFIRKVLPDPELAAFIGRAVGYSLTASTREQCLFLLHGLGANGKSTFIETIRALMGDYALETQAETLMVKSHGSSGPNNDVARLRGARFVSARESEEGQRLAESLVKSLTGGDTITARFLHKEHFEFKPDFKLWLATNHKPLIGGVDDGIWRRMRLIPFDVSIPKQERDLDLPNKLIGELPGILAWAVKACLIWQQYGLREPKTIREATEDYRADMDTLGSFIETHAVTGPNAKEKAGDLYRRYSHWCMDNGERDCGNTAFGRRLNDRGFRSEKRGGVVYRLGLMLKPLPEVAGNGES